MPKSNARLGILIARSLSLPRQLTTALRAQIRQDPTQPLNYTILTDDLADAMESGYQIGYNADGSTLPRQQRQAKRVEYDAQAQDFLLTYQGFANQETQRAYFDALDKGATENQATRAALRRFRTLGFDGSASNKMKTTYTTAIYGAYAEGLYDASQDNPDIIGYRYWTQEDERVRNPEHTQFQGVTMPKDNPFWQLYWPPICWNCRCYIQPLKRTPRTGWKKPPADPVPVCEGYDGTSFTLV